ncbi:cysteine-rich receptor-like protein kinase 10 isoform X3 [Mercurialis annua]|uniref:cysteine-rich receptor-like protein kinase 10 isoform X3 n=1 Tax=Mercurialis annua TaxID=3986 RepID=UPI002160847A|nr:cysteine-rich receptor-like protein kinase 10 isoform X3 [Mercurialis annua]
MGQFQRVAKILNLLFLCFLDLTHADPPYQLCPDINNRTSSVAFQNNLNNLLQSLPTNASVFKTFSSAIGNNTDDKVYSQFMCLNYIPSEKCSTCIRTASEDINSLCTNKSEAIIWEEDCQLRYSNRSFLGQLDVSGNDPLYNKKNISSPDQFKSLVNQTVYGLINQAAFNRSLNMYATGEAAFTSTDNLYALVQCTTDLSSDDCRTCLRVALANLSSCCYFSRGARLLSRSCYLRYELYAFYKGATSEENQGTVGGKKNKTWIVIILTATSAILMILVLILFIYCRFVGKRNAKRRSEIVNQECPLKLQNIVDPANNFLQSRSHHGRDRLYAKDSGFMDLASIHLATDNFSESNFVGQGGFGPVYKGKLSDGNEVAVKRLASSSEQGTEEFTTEVQLIMKLQHKNLVRLLGFCFDGEEKLLVYEFMPNSSLDVILFDRKKRAQLEWRKRTNIINGIAKGLLYLHEDSRLRIIHRDLKASNILLDSEMNPKISDFGTARIFGSEEDANTCRITGTIGYMAPEYAMEGLYSTKSDVFSFGVLLLEIITGKKNTGFNKSNNAPNLSAYAWYLWNKGNEMELKDPLLAGSCCDEEFSRYMHIGLLCLQEDASDRPTMSSVILMLKTESVTLAQPQRPAFSMGRFTTQIEPNFNDCSTNDLTLSNISAR